MSCRVSSPSPAAAGGVSGLTGAAGGPHPECAAAPTAPFGAGRSAGRSGRRGQTLIMALSILFLMTILGAAFITLVLNNLRRVTRQDDTQDALTVALAGLQYAANQFRTSADGADWRPRPTEQFWRTPVPPAIPPIPVNPPDTTGQFDRDGNNFLDAAEIRQMDPDYELLSDSGTFRRPFVRVPTGRGRCLLRVTYLPAFRPGSAASEAAGMSDEYDTNSGSLLIESIGRPGEFDPNDPTFLRNPTEAKPQGPSRKVVAQVPIGLLSQLWWITNHTNERGPASLGVPAFEQPNIAPGQPAQEALTEFPTVFQGSIRSNVSVRFQGRNVLRVYPSRGEGLFVKGDISFGPQANRDPNDVMVNEPELRIDVLADAGGPNAAPTNTPLVPQDFQDDNPADDTLHVSQPALPSSAPTAAFDASPFQNLQTQGGSRVRVVHDERHLRTDTENRARSTRIVEAPRLEQIDPATGVSRWRKLTRDSGGKFDLQLPDGSTRAVNSGWYGLTDINLPGVVRARGLYLDNFGDIQYPDDRRRVKNEWLQRDPQRNGWFGDYYIPAVRDGATGQQREIADVLLTRVINPANGQLIPVIRVRRFDPDTRQMNLPVGAPTDPRLFYTPNVSATTPIGATGSLTNPTQFRDFAYPENGVFFTEGSIRVRGTVGMPGGPRQLTIVSGGTIYVDGNLTRGDGASTVALLAQDFVCLNPTAFTRVEPGSDVVVEPHSWDSETGLPDKWHFSLPQDRRMDFSVTSARPLTSAVLHMQHSAIEGDASSETSVALFRPAPAAGPRPWPDWSLDRVNFGQDLFGTSTPQLFYLFHQFSAGVTPGYAESNFLSRQGQPGNFEIKSFILPQVATGGGLPAGMEGRFRILCGPRDDATGQAVPTQNGQPYWLSRVALLPTDGPLSVKVEAVIYAYTGSWFVIPPPFFNTRPEDSRFRYLLSNQRHEATQPDQGLNADPRSANGPLLPPFYNEPLNVDIQVIGAVNENFPAEPSDVARWSSRLWVGNLDRNRGDGTPDNDPTVWPPPNPDDPSTFLARGRALFSPRLTYRYDGLLRRLVRVRFLRPYAANQMRTEEIAWVAPPPAGGNYPTNVTARRLTAIVSEALANNSYVELLPMCPHLPTGPLLYQGNPL